MSDYHLIKPFYACFIYFLESVPPIYPSGVIFGPHSCLVSAPAADSGQTKRMFGGRSLPWRQKETGDKDDADSQGVFSKWSFIFLAHIFLHSATPPSPPTCKVTSSSTPLYIQLPQNIHFSSSSSSLRFFFHQHNKHRPLGEQCKSRDSVKLLRNAVVMFPYPRPALIYCRSTAKLYVFAFLLSFADVWCRVLFQPSRNEAKKERESDSKDVFMAVCGDTRALCKLSSLTSCCPKKVQ